MHANGASMFFLAVYLHILRGFYYGSYKAPREVLWLLGCVIYLLMMMTAFMGYVLPWGQMSFWGAKVITNLLGAFPVIGGPITTLLWGGFAVDSPTLNRFFSLHYLLPFVIAAVVALHIWALHVPGNSNPTGVNVKSKTDTLPFHPYYTVKDGFAISVFMILFAVFVFYLPDAFVKTRQQHRRQSAGHAGAHRSGMVPAALLRDPAGDPGQADRRPRPRRRHRHAVHPALARHLQGAVHALSAHGADLLLHLDRRLPDSGLVRGRWSPTIR